MVFTLFSISTILLPVLILIFRPGIFASPFKPLAYMVLISMIADIGNIAIFYGVKDGNNLFIWHTYTLLEGLLITLFFYKVLFSSFSKKAVLIGGIGFILFSILNVIFWESIFSYNNIQKYVEHSLVLVITLLYYYDVFKYSEIEKLERDAIFIIASTLLIFCSGTIMLYIANNFMNVEKQVFYYYKIHSTLHIFFNIGIAVSFWKSSKYFNASKSFTQ